MTWVWAPHEEEAFVAAEVKGQSGSDLRVQMHGREVTVPEADCLPLSDHETLSNLLDDLVQLEEVNAGSILHVLRGRFLNDVIYTNLGTILVALNPFKRIQGMYGPEVMDTYTQARGSGLDTPPHIYAIAESAFTSMVDNAYNQSVIISGESGAGKTEATKQCLSYLAAVAGSSTGVEQKIISASPILEAFGNAKTLRNNNSSRFGKWMEIHFSTTHEILGCSNTNYLLEKSRVVFQEAGERNYHIFYQLVSGAPPHLRSSNGLDGPPEAYHYLNQSGCVALDGQDETEEFREVQESLIRLEFSDEEIADLYRVVAAVLLLGNVDFVSSESGEGSTIADGAVAAAASERLAVTDNMLRTALCYHEFKSGSRRGSQVKVELDPTKARESRDALAKAIYGKLFDWLVKRVNEAVSVPRSSAQVIGVLDIFGFEIFEQNSFEQLCINFANEKLQQHFNFNTFTKETELYASEGVTCDQIVFNDNQDVLDLISLKGSGIISMLDEEARVPRGTSMTFFSKLTQKHANNPRLNHRPGQQFFVVVHYAGLVSYSPDGFLKKNKDTLFDELESLMRHSECALLRTIFAPPAAPAGAAAEEAPKRGRGRGGMARAGRQSVGTQFRNQLDSLMATLNATEPHYVRCIKSNYAKQPMIFESPMVFEQLRYSGIFEAVAIRQSGYPFRFVHKRFRERFFMLARREDSQAVFQGDFTAQCTALHASLRARWPELDDLHLGRTMVLYRSPQHKLLERERAEAINVANLRCQRTLRGHLARKKVSRARETVRALHAAEAKRDLDELSAALAEAEEVMQEMAGMDIVFVFANLGKARALKERLEEEKAVNDGLRDLLTRDALTVYRDLVAMLERAAALEMRSAVVSEAQQHRQSVEEVFHAKEDLTNGLRDHDEAAIGRAIAALARLKAAGTIADDFMAAELAEAEALIKVIEEENRAMLPRLQQALAQGRVTVDAQGSLSTADASTTALEETLQATDASKMRTRECRDTRAAIQLMIGVRKSCQANDWPAIERALADVDPATVAVAAREEIDNIKNEVSNRQVGARLEEAVARGRPPAGAPPPFDKAAIDADGLAALVREAARIARPNARVGQLLELADKLQRLRAAFIAEDWETLEEELRDASGPEADSYQAELVYRRTLEQMHAALKSGRIAGVTGQIDTASIAADDLVAAVEVGERFADSPGFRELLPTARLLAGARRALKARDWDALETALQGYDPESPDNSNKELRLACYELHNERITTALTAALQSGAATGAVGELRVEQAQTEALQAAEQLADALVCRTPEAERLRRTAALVAALRTAEQAQDWTRIEMATSALEGEPPAEAEAEAEMHAARNELSHRTIMAALGDALQRGAAAGSPGHVDAGAVDFEGVDAAVRQSEALGPKAVAAFALLAVAKAVLDLRRAIVADRWETDVQRAVDALQRMDALPSAAEAEAAFAQDELHNRLQLRELTGGLAEGRATGAVGILNTTSIDLAALDHALSTCDRLGCKSPETSQLVATTQHVRRVRQAMATDLMHELDRDQLVAASNECFESHGADELRLAVDELDNVVILKSLAAGLTQGCITGRPGSLDKAAANADSLNEAIALTEQLTPKTVEAERALENARVISRLRAAVLADDWEDGANAAIDAANAIMARGVGDCKRDTEVLERKLATAQAAQTAAEARLGAAEAHEAAAQAAEAVADLERRLVEAREAAAKAEDDRREAEALEGRVAEQQTAEAAAAKTAAAADAVVVEARGALSAAVTGAKRRERELTAATNALADAEDSVADAQGYVDTAHAAHEDIDEAECELENANAALHEAMDAHDAAQRARDEAKAASDEARSGMAAAASAAKQAKLGLQEAQAAVAAAQEAHAAHLAFVEAAKAAHLTYQDLIELPATLERELDQARSAAADAAAAAPPAEPANQETLTLAQLKAKALQAAQEVVVVQHAIEAPLLPLTQSSIDEVRLGESEMHLRRTLRELPEAMAHGQLSGAVGSVLINSVSVEALEPAVAHGQQWAETAAAQALLQSATLLLRVRTALMQRDWTAVGDTLAEARRADQSDADVPASHELCAPELALAVHEVQDRDIRRAFTAAMSAGAAPGAVGALDVAQVDAASLEEALATAARLQCRTAEAELLQRVGTTLLKARKALRTGGVPALDRDELVAALEPAAQTDTPAATELQAVLDELDNHRICTDLEAALTSGAAAGQLGAWDSAAVDVAALDAGIAYADDKGAKTAAARDLLFTARLVRSLRAALLDDDWVAVRTAVGEVNAAHETTPDRLLPAALAEVAAAENEVHHRLILSDVTRALESGSASGSTGALNLATVAVADLQVAVEHATQWAERSRTPDSAALLASAQFVLDMRVALGHADWPAIEAALEARAGDDVVPVAAAEVRLMRDEVDNRNMQSAMLAALAEGGPAGAVAHVDLLAIRTAGLAKAIAESERVGCKTEAAAAVLQSAKLILDLRHAVKGDRWEAPVYSWRTAVGETTAVAAVDEELPKEQGLDRGLSVQAVLREIDSPPDIIKAEVNYVTRELSNRVVVAEQVAALSTGQPSGVIGNLELGTIDVEQLDTCIAHADELGLVSDEAIKGHATALLIRKLRALLLRDEWAAVPALVEQAHNSFLLPIVTDEVEFVADELQDRQAQAQCLRAFDAGAMTGVVGNLDLDTVAVDELDAALTACAALKRRGAALNRLVKIVGMVRSVRGGLLQGDWDAVSEVLEEVSWAKDEQLPAAVRAEIEGVQRHVNFHTVTRELTEALANGAPTLEPDRLAVEHVDVDTLPVMLEHADELNCTARQAVVLYNTASLIFELRQAVLVPRWPAVESRVQAALELKRQAQLAHVADEELRTYHLKLQDNEGQRVLGEAVSESGVEGEPGDVVLAKVSVLSLSDAIDHAAALQYQSVTLLTLLDFARQLRDLRQAALAGEWDAVVHDAAARLQQSADHGLLPERAQAEVALALRHAQFLRVRVALREALGAGAPTGETGALALGDGAVDVARLDAAVAQCVELEVEAEEALVLLRTARIVRALRAAMVADRWENDVAAALAQADEAAREEEWSPLAAAELQRARDEMAHRLTVRTLSAALSAGQAEGDPGELRLEGVQLEPLQQAIKQAADVGCKAPLDRQLLESAHVVLALRTALVGGNWFNVKVALQQAAALPFGVALSNLAVAEVSLGHAERDYHQFETEVLAALEKGRMGGSLEAPDAAPIDVAELTEAMANGARAAAETSPAGARVLQAAQLVAALRAAQREASWDVLRSVLDDIRAAADNNPILQERCNEELSFAERLWRAHTVAETLRDCMGEGMLQGPLGEGDFEAVDVTAMRAAIAECEPLHTPGARTRATVRLMETARVLASVRAALAARDWALLGEALDTRNPPAEEGMAEITRANDECRNYKASERMLNALARPVVTGLPGAIALHPVALSELQAAIDMADALPRKSEAVTRLAAAALMLANLRQAVLSDNWETAEEILREVDREDMEDVARRVNARILLLTPDPDDDDDEPSDYLEEVILLRGHADYRVVMRQLTEAVGAGMAEGAVGELNTSTIDTEALEAAIANALELDVDAPDAVQLLKSAKLVLQLRAAQAFGRWVGGAGYGGLEEDAAVDHVVEVAQAGGLSPLIAGEVAAARDELNHRAIVRALTDAVSSGGPAGHPGALDVAHVTTRDLQAAVELAQRLGCKSPVASQLLVTARLLLRARSAVKNKEWHNLEAVLAEAAGNVASAASGEVSLYRGEWNHHRVHVAVLEAYAEGAATGSVGQFHVSTVDVRPLNSALALAAQLKCTSPESQRLVTAATLVLDVRVGEKVGDWAAVGEGVAQARAAREADAAAERACFLDEAWEEIAFAELECNNRVIIAALTAALKTGMPEGEVGALNYDDIETEELQDAIDLAERLACRTAEARGLFQTACVIYQLRLALKARDWPTVTDALASSANKAMAPMVSEELNVAHDELNNQTIINQLLLALSRGGPSRAALPGGGGKPQPVPVEQQQQRSVAARARTHARRRQSTPLIFGGISLAELNASITTAEELGCHSLRAKKLLLSAQVVRSLRGALMEHQWFVVKDVLARATHELLAEEVEEELAAIQHAVDYRDVVSEMNAALTSGRAEGDTGEMDYSTVELTALDDAITNAARFEFSEPEVVTLLATAGMVLQLRVALRANRWEAGDHGVLVGAAHAGLDADQTVHVRGVLDKADAMEAVSSVAHLELQAARDELDDHFIIHSLTQALAAGATYLDDMESMASIDTETLERAVAEAAELGPKTATATRLLLTARVVFRLRSALRRGEWEEFRLALEDADRHDLAEVAAREIQACQSEELNHDVINTKLRDALTTGKPEGQPQSINLDNVRLLELDAAVLYANRHGVKSKFTRALLQSAQVVRDLRMCLVENDWQGVPGVLRRANQTHLSELVLDEIGLVQATVDYRSVMEELRRALVSGRPTGEVGHMDARTIDVTALDNAIALAGIGVRSEEIEVLTQSAGVVRRLRGAIAADNWESIAGASKNFSRSVALRAARQAESGQLEGRELADEAERSYNQKQASERRALFASTATASSSEAVPGTASLLEVDSVRSVLSEAWSIRLAPEAEEEVRRAQDELNFRTVVKRLTEALSSGMASGEPGALDTSTLEQRELAEAIRFAQKQMCSARVAEQLFMTAKIVRNLRAAVAERNWDNLKASLETVDTAGDNDMLAPLAAGEITLYKEELNHHLLVRKLTRALKKGMAGGETGAVQLDSIDLGPLTEAIQTATQLVCPSPLTRRLLHTATVVHSLRRAMKVGNWELVRELVEDPDEEALAVSPPSVYELRFAKAELDDRTMVAALEFVLQAGKNALQSDLEDAILMAEELGCATKRAQLLKDTANFMCDLRQSWKTRDWPRVHELVREARKYTLSTLVREELVEAALEADRAQVTGDLVHTVRAIGGSLAPHGDDARFAVVPTPAVEQLDELIASAANTDVRASPDLTSAFLVAQLARGVCFMASVDEDSACPFLVPRAVGVRLASLLAKSGAVDFVALGVFVRELCVVGDRKLLYHVREVLIEHEALFPAHATRRCIKMLGEARPMPQV